MKVLSALAGAPLLIAALASPAAAQSPLVRGFAAAGSASDVNRQNALTFGGGVLVDLGQPWVSAGAQGDALTRNGYYAGRGAVFGQFNPLGAGPIRPFVLGGMGFGEWAGPLIGGGVEVRTGPRLGFRLALEDYTSRHIVYDRAFVETGRETGHQVSVKFGVLF
jgi:hypothetical protein